MQSKMRTHMFAKQTKHRSRGLCMRVINFPFAVQVACRRSGSASRSWNIMLLELHERSDRFSNAEFEKGRLFF